MLKYKYTKLILLLIIFGFIGAFYYYYPPALRSDSKLITGTLDNGFKFSIYNTVSPESDVKVSIRLWVNVGSYQENGAQKGFAHIVEHMAFEDSKNFSYDEKNRHLTEGGLSLGTHSNAYTFHDHTLYFIDERSSQKSRINRNLKMFRDIVGNILFNKKQVRKEKSIVLAELRERDHQVQTRIKHIKKRFSNNAQYLSAMPIGNKNSIENADAKNLNEFYKKWYQPQFMHLIVAGDVDVNEIRKQIHLYFADLEKNMQAKQAVQTMSLKSTVVFNKISRGQNIFEFNVPLSSKDEKLSRLKNYQNSLDNNFIILAIEETLQQINQQIGNLFEAIRVNIISEAGVSFLNVQFKHHKLDRYKAAEFVTTALVKIKTFGFTDVIFEKVKARKEALKKYSGTALWFGRAPQQIVQILLNSKQSDVENISYNSEIAQKTYHLRHLDRQKINYKVKLFLKNEAQINLDQKDGFNTFSNVSIKAQLFAYNNNSIKADAYQKFDDKNSLSPIVARPGHIVKRVAKLHANVSHFTLSNGISVYAIDRKVEKKQISISAYSTVGSGFLPLKLLIANQVAERSLAANGLGGLTAAQFGHFLKTNEIEFNRVSEKLYSGFKLSLKKQQLPLALQLLHYAFTENKPKLKSFESAKERLLYNTKQNTNTYFGLHRQKFNKARHSQGDSRLNFTLKNTKTLDIGDVASLEKLKFGDGRKITIVIAGDFKDVDWTELLENNIASIPSKPTKTKYLPIKIKPQNINVKTYENRRNEAIYDIQYLNDTLLKTPIYKEILKMMTRIVQKKIFEQIREDKTLIYSSNVNLEHALNSFDATRMSIKLVSSPKDEKQVLETIELIMTQLKTNGISSSDYENDIRVYGKKSKSNILNNQDYADFYAKTHMGLKATSSKPKFTFAQANKISKLFLKDAFIHTSVFSKKQ